MVNAIVRAEAEPAPGRVAFVDTYRMFRTKEGGFIQRIRDEDGKLVEVRSPDGLHFEPAGGDRVAKVVLEQIEASRPQYDGRRETSRRRRSADGEDDQPRSSP